LWLATLALTFAVHRAIPSEPPASREDVFLPKPQLAKLASLGFDAVLSDYYWIQAIYKVGATRERPEEFAPYVSRIIDVVTTLDPWVGHPYRFGAIWLTDSPESVRRGNELLRRGIEYHPDDWRNYFYLGYNHFYYLRENEAAADALEKATELEGSPTYLPRLVARLRSENADLESSVIFLTQLIESSESEDAVAVYQGALDEIDVEIKARGLDRARESFEQLAGHDIEGLHDLVEGRFAVLETLPPAEPRDLPQALHKGDRWFVDPETGRITSTYYNRRYRVNTRAQGEAWEGEAMPSAEKEVL
jgi:tetratricopeptide (TPR) repeat protein